ncbi:hypothetical protein FKM82_017555 [Ascaphus truei]
MTICFADSMPEGLTPVWRAPGIRGRSAHTLLGIFLDVSLFCNFLFCFVFFPRKLKNRVAAQTARDRKKAKMGELEQQVVELEIENEKLLIENQILQEKTHVLVTENQALRQRLGLDALEMKEELESEVLIKSRRDEIRLVTGSAESAALRLCAPLQQEQAQKSPSLTMSTWILTALTLQTLSLISCWAFW